MMKIKLGILLLAIAILPKTTWQISKYVNNERILTVYSGVDASTPICFQGDAKDYDGSCVSPKAPTSAYIEEQIRLEKLEKIEY